MCGYLFFEKSGAVTPSTIHSSRWNHKVAKTHIFIKEMLAAVMAIERAGRLFPTCKRIRIACDNTAACHCLRRMYSTNSVAVDLLKRIYRCLGRTILLEVVSVRGVDNAADCPSRGCALEPRRNEATWRELMAFDEGNPRVAAIIDVNTAVGTRHPEPDDDIFEDIGSSAGKACNAEKIPSPHLDLSFLDAEN
jgi:hypothetical protein